LRAVIIHARELTARGFTPEMEELANRNSEGISARWRCGIRPAADARSFPAALLTGDFLSEGIRSAADAAGTLVIAAFDATVHSLVTFTSAPGAGFGPAVPAGDATSVTASLDLTVPGRATLVWTSSAGAFDATEPVS
jgi:hypothetical protein